MLRTDFHAPRLPSGRNEFIDYSNDYYEREFLLSAQQK